MRLAIVSSDGVNVDLHLGKAKSVYIYDWQDEIKFIEKRNIDIDVNSKHQGNMVIKVCSDCDVLISLKYGFKTKILADELEIKLVMDEGTIDEVLQRYINHYNFMHN
ncbi:MAG: NifB/NifX family molybdenum-iron cluster-binding protein [Methanobrevibacter sp.]|uniref:NifB/NifX family molybdenum-iron cluster-binding protein n=1 Tax=Methanobrevibacter sp. TaxID=66852 RepID=UPI003F0A7C7F